MCGIIARVGDGDAVEEVLTGLENLEYRGYDSAGVAVKNGSGLRLCKREGEVSSLRQQLEAKTPRGDVAIGHTRWSTHGVPSDSNAHPHTDCVGEVAVVHNGIIENHDDLRTELRHRGHVFESDTDTEVVPHLIEERLESGFSPEAAFRRTMRDLEGSYAVATMIDGCETVYAARRGSPLVLGLRDDGTQFLASDVPAFLEFTDEVIYLEDGDVAVVDRDDYRVTDLDGVPVDRQPEVVDWVADDARKGRYDHFMFKEINEQPTALAQALKGRIDGDDVSLDEFPPGAFAGVGGVHLVACGTSYHAALQGRHFLESRGVSASAHLGSEFATSPPPLDGESLVLGVTQSGETADTLESLRRATAAGARTLAVTNVVGSTAARECDDALFIRAGPEIGVAATKTFSCQVATLLLLAERVARDATGSGADDAPAVLDALASLPDHVEAILQSTTASDVADRYADEEAYFFVGRENARPVALEGALKFKEITYEHAEGFAAGELKHGPLALVTPETPVFAVFTGDAVGKTLGNVREVQARGAPVVAVATEGSDVAEIVDETLAIPRTHPEVASILGNVQLQLVSYHVAKLLSRAIDKPRNLAKSVTVE